jgi:hypothetical protein
MVMENREIDYLIFEHVLKNEKGYMEYLKQQKDDLNLYIVKRYSTNIQDAWVVVDKLNKQWEFELYRDNGKDEPFYCDFSGYDKFAYVDRFYRGVANTAPLAICKAALKSVGIDL